MKKKSLIETNPYLKDPELRKKLVIRSVRTSCAVEGIPPSPSQDTYLSSSLPNNEKAKHRC